MDKKGKILIIDDNEDVLFALNALLLPYMESIKVSVSPEKLIHYQRTFKPDVILLDMNFRMDVVSGKEGFLWLKKLLDADPDAIVILMTAYADTAKAVQAIKAGATDYISKPWEKEKLLATISSALKLKESRRQVENLKAQVASLSMAEPVEFIGKSKEMMEIFSMIEKLSATETNILLLGENGTGKDLIAKEIYFNSLRRNKVFISIDLGAIPETLFESELFGYEKGAFTDAVSDKAGRMEIASGGTLFLDEIGNLSLPMQTKLLSAIEKKQTSRLGSTRTLPIDVRLICATNLDIYEAALKGTFRQDLLYRINTIEIKIPPLRDRGEDKILLANFFLRKFALRYKKAITSLSQDAKNKIMSYHWPGNVRELQNIMERAVILTSDRTLKPDSIVLSATNRKRDNETLNLLEIERATIEIAMQRSGGNMNKAAEMLGISRFALYRKINLMN